MPNQRIDQLPGSGNQLKGDDLIPIFSDGKTERVSITDLTSYSGFSSSPFQYNSGEVTAIEPILGSNSATGTSATIGGGVGNTSNGNYSTIGGGNTNTTSGHFSIVGGGVNNTSSGSNSFVGGGLTNINDGVNGFIGGGTLNVVNNNFSSIIGGQSNVVNHDNSHLVGSNITSVSANTTHVEKLNIKTLNGTAINVGLGLDINGMVVTNPNTISSFSVNITSAQILDLHNNVIELVAAPDGNSYIELISTSSRYIFDTSAYTSNISIQIKCTSTSNSQRELSNILGSTSTTLSNSNIPSTVNQDQIALGDSLVASLPAAALSGDGDITISGTYRIVTLLDGCTDPGADNYNPFAINDDGSCTYP